MAIKLEPNDSENWSNLGAALIGQQRNSEAESCFRRAITIDGLKAGNWSNLATALANQERLEETVAALQQAVAIDPQSAEIWGRLGTTEQQLGRLAEAQEAYERRITSNEWRVVAGFSDDEDAELVRRDRIDVLFDLAGHFGNRLLVFARKPAPIQVTWLGYAGTTGLSAMDFILADRFHIPDGEQGWYAENVLRMPNAYACFAPSTD